MCIYVSPKSWIMINTGAMSMFIVLLWWHGHWEFSHPVRLMTVEQHQMAVDPQTKLTNLFLKVIKLKLNWRQWKTVLKLDSNPERRQITQPARVCGLFAAYSVVLFLNFLGAMAYFFGCIQSSMTTEDSGVTFGLSIVFFILFIPCSFICWYRPLYKAFRSDSSLSASSSSSSLFTVSIINRCCSLFYYSYYSLTLSISYPEGFKKLRYTMQRSWNGC